MKFSDHPMFQGLPGESLIVKGISDIGNGLHTPESCLVRIASNRLARAGYSLNSKISPDNAELELYEFYTPLGNDAHSKYNAMIRQLVSFEQALDHRLSRAA